MCVCVLLPSSRFFLSLGLVLFSIERKKDSKRGCFLSSFPRGGDQPFFFLSSSSIFILPFSTIGQTYRFLRILRRFFRSYRSTLPSSLFQFFLDERKLTSRVTKIAINDDRLDRLFFFKNKYFSSGFLLFQSLKSFSKSNTKTSSSRKTGDFSLLDFPRFSRSRNRGKNGRARFFGGGPAKKPGFETSSPRGRCTAYTRGREGPPRGRRTLTGREASQEDYRKQIISVEILLANSPDTLPRSNVSGHGIVLWNRGRRSCEISFR